MSGRIYLSGPMSGYPGHNFVAFNDETRRLRALGYEVVNPVEINPDANTSWHDCLKADLRALLDCSVIATLPGWELSQGAVLEVHVAQRLGFKAFPSRLLIGQEV